MGTNVDLRCLNNFVFDMAWLPWPILPKRQWPKVQYKDNRRRTLTMKRVVEFEGLDEADIPLSRDGILRKYKFIAGLAVPHEGKIWGAALRCRENLNAVMFLEDLCEQVAIETPDSIS